LTRAVGREPGAAERVAVFIDYQNVYMRAREAFFGHYSLIHSESHALVSRLCHESACCLSELFAANTSSYSSRRQPHHPVT